MSARDLIYAIYRSGGIHLGSNHCLPLEKALLLYEGSECQKHDLFHVYSYLWQICNTPPPFCEDIDALNTCLAIADALPRYFVDLNLDVAREHVRRAIRLSRRKPSEIRRIRALNFTSNPRVRGAVFDRDGCFCRCCNSTDKPTLDHIIPVSAGGENELKNLQVLCRSCNSRKGAKHDQG